MIARGFNITRKFPAALLLIGAMSAIGPGYADVNIYSYRQSYLIQPVLDAYTADTGVAVNVVYAKQGLLERLEREGRNSPADLLLTADIGRLLDATAAGLTQAVDSPVLDQNVPANYRDPQGHWFGLTSRARIIVASRERVPEGSIERYEDLAASQWRGRICTRSGKHPYMTALIAATIAHHGEDGARVWLQGVRDNLARKPQGNDRAQVKAISEGVCDVAVINHYYMALMLADPEQRPWAESVSVIFPNQRDRGTHMNVSGVALTAAAPNRDAAVRLMEFLSTDTAQQLYAQENFEYPVARSVPWPDLLSDWGQFRPDPVDLAEVARYRAAASRLADEVGYDG